MDNGYDFLSWMKQAGLLTVDEIAVDQVEHVPQGTRPSRRKGAGFARRGCETLSQHTWAGRSRPRAMNRIRRPLTSFWQSDEMFWSLAPGPAPSSNPDVGQASPGDFSPSSAAPMAEAGIFALTDRRRDRQIHFLGGFSLRQGMPGSELHSLLPRSNTTPWETMVQHGRLWKSSQAGRASCEAEKAKAITQGRRVVTHPEGVEPPTLDSEVPRFAQRNCACFGI